MPKKKKLTTILEASEPLSWRSINPNAQSPDMEPTGSDTPSLYICGEAPGQDEDFQGEQFVGRSGDLIRRQIPDWFAKEVRWNNAVRTRPVTESGANRTPTKEEVDYYLPSLLEDIAKTKPKVVLAVGNIPLSALIPGLGGIMTSRGTEFPIQIGDFKTWVIPVLHPSYILRVEKITNSKQEVPGAEQKRTWSNDIKKAIDLSSAENYSKPTVVDIEQFKKENIIIASQFVDVMLLLDELMNAKTVAFDFETTKLRPYQKDAKIISMAFSFRRDSVPSYDQAITFAFGYESDQVNWTPEQLTEITEKLKLFFTKGKAKKIAHNLNFELEWLVHRFGIEVAFAGSWADTESESFVLDERPGVHDLGFCTRRLFGFNVKDLSTVNVKKIAKEPINEVLQYNAYDAKATLILHYLQQKEIYVFKLQGILNEHIKRIPTLVLAQNRGLLVNQDKVTYYSEKLGKDIEAIKAKIMSQPEVAKFEEVFGVPYMPTSSQKTVKLLKEIIGRTEGQKKNGKFTTNKEALKEMKGCKIAKMLLEFRELTKLKSTYVDSLKTGGKFLHPDGRVHCIFTTTKTLSGRTSSKQINCQNFPSRKNKEIRSQIVADAECQFVAVDFAQIEARVIGMASNDSFLCKATKEGYDIHADWANKIIKLSPSTYKKRGEDFKLFRSQIKNELVFPLFYGSQPSALAARLGISDTLAKKIYDDFWRMFPGVQRWQKEVLRDYREKGYVETLTGRRRHAPMSADMALNHVIQGSASDIVVDAMTRLSRMAQEQGKPWLQAVLNIHDDLTFCVPVERLEEAIETIVTAMTTPTYEWINLPLEVEVSMGPDWGSLSAMGKFQTVA